MQGDRWLRVYGAGSAARGCAVTGVGAGRRRGAGDPGEAVRRSQEELTWMRRQEATRFGVAGGERGARGVAVILGRLCRGWRAQRGPASGGWPERSSARRVFGEEERED